MTADVIRADVLSPALWWLTGWSLAYHQGTTAELLAEWDQLLADVDAVLAELDEVDQAAVELRAVVATVKPRVEAWHAGAPMDELGHDDLVRELERHGRRIEAAEKGELFDEAEWESASWWPRAHRYARVWTERLGTGPEHECWRVLELVIAAAHSTDPVLLDSVLVAHPDHESLRRWLADRLVHGPAVSALDAASRYCEDPTLPPHLARIALHEGQAAARFVLHDVAARPHG